MVGLLMVICVIAFAIAYMVYVPHIMVVHQPDGHLCVEIHYWTHTVWYDHMGNDIPHKERKSKTIIRI